MGKEVRRIVIVERLHLHLGRPAPVKWPPYACEPPIKENPDPDNTSIKLAVPWIRSHQR
ncbi:MAG: hypothetical protein HY675_02630 [Chloroflexi bacterium]|nr:hypothetical protein [Chloroflexota bacterium]